MVRITSGDYLLPSNDGATLWRLSRYREDGSLIERRGTFWMLSRWQRRLNTDDWTVLDQIDPDDWNQWETWETLLRSRNAAIAAALSARS